MKTIADTAIETRWLVEALAKAAVGQEFTYEELAKIAGCDLAGRPHILWSARRIVAREHGIQFSAITAVGIKRMNDVEILELQATMPRRIGRFARTSLHRLAAVEYAKLSPAQKITHCTTASVLGAIMSGTKSAKIRRIESKVGEAGTVKLDFGETLRALAEG